MRIVIDCFKLVKGQGKSIGIYNLAGTIIRNLINEKQKTNNQIIKSSEVIVLGNAFNKNDFSHEGIKFVEIEKYDPLKKWHCVIWELFAVSSICKKLKADRILFPRGYSALTHPIDDTVLIHDMIPFYYKEHFPNYFNKIENEYIMIRLKQSARTARKIITRSEASKRDIIKYCGVNEDKITVIVNPCDIIKYDNEKEHNTSPYISAVTSKLPHKNAIGILKSYEHYRRISNNPLDLRIIGIEEPLNIKINEETYQHIAFYKYIKSNDEMHKLIANSDIFMFLSLIEGYGLPPIEAMMLDVPVICSNTSSLPEVVGDAAVLVNPKDYEIVAENLNKLQMDKHLKNELVKKGKHNVKERIAAGKESSYWDVLINTGR